VKDQVKNSVEQAQKLVGLLVKKFSVKAQDEVQEINNIKLPGAVEANKGLMGG